MADDVILMTWPEQSKAYQGYSNLQELSANGAVDLKGAAVVQRNPDGTLAVKDGNDNTVGVGTLSGSAIGMLIGVLGGPLGLLLGWAGGALIGGSFDLDRTATTTGALGELSKAIPPGTTGLVAEVGEGSTAAVDKLAADTGATLDRKPTQEVLDELAAAEDAAQAAADAAAAKMHEERKAERKADWDQRIDKLKAKLHA